MDNLYLQRYANPGPRVTAEVPQDLSLVVVIPSCAEEKLDQALVSLIKCERPSARVEVIVVVNHSESSDQYTRQLNLQSIRKAETLLDQCPEWLDIHLIQAFDLPEKHAGVGLARKIGMDEAVRRFEKIRSHQSDIHRKGIIICFDADCTCDPDYFVAIESHFSREKTPACTIYYEHPVAGSEYPEEIYQGIIQYEMHLRYYVDALRWAKYPYAWQTVGSAIAVRSNVYQKQGGMNLRKAGEDFYFLQKLFPLPGFSELNATRVIPSPRVSLRVPFGTGKVMSEWIGKDKSELLTFSPQSFRELNFLLQNLPLLFQQNGVKTCLDKLPPGMQSYLEHRNFSAALQKIKSNSGGYYSFQKLFFAWLNGLKVLQFFHFARKHYYNDLPVVEATGWLLKELTDISGDKFSNKDLLLQLRALDKKSNYFSNRTSN